MEYILSPANIYCSVQCKNCNCYSNVLSLSDIVIKHPYGGNVEIGYKCPLCRSENMPTSIIPQPTQTYGSTGFKVYKTCMCGNYMTFTKENGDMGFKLQCSKCGADWIP